LVVPDEKVTKAVEFMAYSLHCGNCGTRARYGDYECPHCGRDLEEDLRFWAAGMLERVLGREGEEAESTG
jgi:hypothetical protein